MLVEDVSDAASGHLLSSAVGEQRSGPADGPREDSAVGVTLNQSGCRRHQRNDPGLTAFAGEFDCCGSIGPEVAEGQVGYLLDPGADVNARMTWLASRPIAFKRSRIKASASIRIPSIERTGSFAIPAS